MNIEYSLKYYTFFLKEKNPENTIINTNNHVETLPGISHSYMVLCENRILFKEHCPSSHSSALLSPSSALVLFTSTPRLEADEKGILFSQGERDDLAQSSSDWDSGLIRTFSTDTSNHPWFLKPE